MIQHEGARNIDFVGHTDQGGKGDGVQVMVAGGHAYIGTDQPITLQQPAKWDTYRGQLAYKLDLTHENNLLHWLGMSQFTLKSLSCARDPVCCWSATNALP